MTDKETIQHLVLPSKVESLTEIESFIEKFCDEHKFEEDNYGNILIALTEAVNNAICHGNNSDASKNVNLMMTSSSKELVFVVEDEGLGFDFNNVPDPTLPQNLKRDNGRGIFIMRALADQVEFMNGGNKIQLLFNLSSN